MSKSIAKKTATVSHVILAETAGVTDPLPTVDPPTPPSGTVSVKLGRAYRPLKSQINLAPKAANELRSNTGYALTFGSSAPDAGNVADALTTASEWSGKLQLASAWYGYVKQQEALAWKHALGVTEPLRVPFEYQSERDPSVAKTFPSLTAYFAAPKERAAKGLATKKRNKLAARAAATAQPATAATAAAPATTSPTDAVKAAAVKLLN